MIKLIVDSSVIVKWVNQIDEPRLEQSELLYYRVKSGEIELITSELAKYEVGNALSVGKKLSGVTLKDAIILLYSLPLTFVSVSTKLALITSSFVQRSHITYYDASFLALGYTLNATLVTDNPKHQKKKIKGVKVIALKDYK